MIETDLDGDPVTDDELTALALAADLDTVVGDDALSVWDVLGDPDNKGVGLLPEWYMPTAIAGFSVERKRWHRPVAILLIASFLIIDALGLCITYGQLVVA
jgi:hypothetical protein